MIRWRLSEGERTKSIEERIRNLPPALKEVYP